LDKIQRTAIEKQSYTLFQASFNSARDFLADSTMAAFETAMFMT